ncbi:Histidine biosynthesis bifunctional protein hisIE [Thermodesulfobium narugense DSM 14796]|uniref:Histidine biosynthesis bifunctional protein HisIE n=1 Tax=Thermodesulfobium narugense DSM 14796 TaxID=747365 RepID=M1E849_9BACT|nr:bifunctional phosphoribosyl-AMP cyclohydrolase/phosphoribosyl-ATP diphosphatase HisIE [Thermodesulfobium narugense]AEE14958.1 Histidine biosynthesis bifunctional protein hisIE [Thermodesulfobium narugense DSM 14796]
MIDDIVSKIKFDNSGLVPAIVQDFYTLEVLMMAYMNEESLKKTIETNETWFYSRSRKCLWHKGETSGHIQRVKEIRIDCDEDTLLVLVEQVGGIACHTGNRSCFYRKIDNNKLVEAKSKSAVLPYLFSVFKDREESPKPDSYVSRLLNKGKSRILQKLGEEAVEAIIAGMKEDRSEFVYEITDLYFHLALSLYTFGLSFDNIYEELIRRKKDEKNG